MKLQESRLSPEGLRDLVACLNAEHELDQFEKVLHHASDADLRPLTEWANERFFSNAARLEKRITTLKAQGQLSQILAQLVSVLESPEDATLFLLQLGEMIESSPDFERALKKIIARQGDPSSQIGFFPEDLAILTERLKQITDEDWQTVVPSGAAISTLIKALGSSIATGQFFSLQDRLWGSVSEIPTGIRDLNSALEFLNANSRRHFDDIFRLVAIAQEGFPCVENSLRAQDLIAITLQEAKRGATPQALQEIFQNRFAWVRTAASRFCEIPAEFNERFHSLQRDLTLAPSAGAFRVLEAFSMDDAHGNSVLSQVIQSSASREMGPLLALFAEKKIWTPVFLALSRLPNVSRARWEEFGSELAHLAPAFESRSPKSISQLTQAGLRLARRLPSLPSRVDLPWGALGRLARQPSFTFAMVEFRSLIQSGRMEDLLLRMVSLYRGQSLKFPDPVASPVLEENLLRRHLWREVDVHQVPDRVDSHPLGPCATDTNWIDCWGTDPNYRDLAQGFRDLSTRGQSLTWNLLDQFWLGMDAPQKTILLKSVWNDRWSDFPLQISTEKIQGVLSELVRQRADLQKDFSVVNGWLKSVKNLDWSASFFDGLGLHRSPSPRDQSLLPKVKGFLEHVLDPQDQNPDRPAWLAFASFLGAFEKNPQELYDFFWLRSQDTQSVLWYDHGDAEPKLKRMNSLMRLEGVLESGNFHFISSDNFSYKFMTQIAEAWGDEPRDEWPAEIQRKFSVRHPPRTLRQAIDDIDATLQVYRDWAGLPDQGGRLGKIAPLYLREANFNSRQVFSVLRENLPDSSSRFRGGLKVLRRLFFELLYSSREECRGPGAGSCNHLSYLTQIVKLGLLDDLSSGLRQIPAAESDIPGLKSALDLLARLLEQPDAMHAMIDLGVRGSALNLDSVGPILNWFSHHPPEAQALALNLTRVLGSPAFYDWAQEMVRQPAALERLLNLLQTDIQAGKFAHDLDLLKHALQ